MSFEILHRYTNAVLYTSATAAEIATAVVEAAKNGADLGGANLEGAIIRSILQIGGSRHWLVAIATDESVLVKIGCHERTLDKWLEGYEAIGKREEYTAAQIAEYGAHLRYVADWASRLPPPNMRRAA